MTKYRVTQKQTITADNPIWLDRATALHDLIGRWEKALLVDDIYGWFAKNQISYYRTVLTVLRGKGWWTKDYGGGYILLKPKAELITVEQCLELYREVKDYHSVLNRKQRQNPIKLHNPEKAQRKISELEGETAVVCASPPTEQQKALTHLYNVVTKVILTYSPYSQHVRDMIAELVKDPVFEKHWKEHLEKIGQDL